MRHPTLIRLPSSGWGRSLRVATLAAAGTAAVLTLGLGAAGLNHSSVARQREGSPSKATATRTSTSSRPAAAWEGSGLIDAGPFVGSWHVHTVLLDIRSDGTGTAQWPTHNWCDAGVRETSTACDRLVPVGRGEQIVDGGRAQIRLAGVSGATADASVEGSTDPAFLPDGAVALTVTPEDVLTVRSASSQLALCGSQASSLTVQQQETEGINCGA